MPPGFYLEFYFTTMPDFRRKPNRLPQLSYHGQRCYFLTICTRDRKKVFTDGALVRALLDLLRDTCLSHSFGVHAYCFMPDHLHLVLVGAHDSANLPQMIRAFKGAGAARARARGLLSLWQKGFYDHVIQAGTQVDAAAWYIFMHPVRAGLVKQIGEWSYSGSLMFDWKKLAIPAEAFIPPWKKPVAG